MPLTKCRKNGRPWYKWWKSGACYTYVTNNPSSRESAKKKAMRQARAIEANK